MPSASDRPLRLGLVGLGRWGTRYLETVNGIPEAQLAAVTTSRPRPPGLDPDCQLFARWPEMLAAAHLLDGVILAVPPALHRPMAEACVEWQVPVLVEKPMATSVEDAVAMAAAAHRSQVPIMVDHTHLFSPAFERLRRIVGAGPLEIHGCGGADGPLGRSVDPLWDWGPHDVAMVLALTGSMPIEVEARREPGPGGRSLSRLTLRFERGDKATLVVGNGMACKTRSLEVDDGEQRLVYDDLAADKLVRYVNGGGEAIAVSAELPLRRVVKKFLRTIRVREVHASAALGVDVVRVLETADRRQPR
jgi:predicted dehydrogenase